jgi:hypothetical protein
VDQQRGSRQPIIIVGKLTRVFAAIDEFGDEVPKRFEHKASW